MFELLKAVHEIQPALSINVVMTAMFETVAFEKVGNSFDDFQFSCGLLRSVLDIAFTPRTLPTNTVLSMNIYLLCLQDVYVPNSTLLQRLIRLPGILLHWAIVFSQFVQAYEKRKRHDCMTS